MMVNTVSTLLNGKKPYWLVEWQHSMNDVSFLKHVSKAERNKKEGKISSTRKKQSKEITVMLHRRCQSSTSDSLHELQLVCLVTGIVSPYPAD